MRILLHDFGGYPYPEALSRELARRGHEVVHVYCASLPTTPQSGLSRKDDDPEDLAFLPIKLGQPLDKYSFLKRWRQENEYGRYLVKALKHVRPDVVISANAPLDPQRMLLKECRRNGIRFVFWVQDLIGIAADRILRKKIPVAGALVGGYYLNLEKRLLRQSDAVVVLTEDFEPIMEEWGVDRARVTTIENWAPIEGILLSPKDNEWSRRYDLHDKFVFLYAGTMGMKHNPELILRLAEAMRDRPEVRVVVASQGLGAEWLEKKKAEHGLENLLILGFFPFKEMHMLMGGSDVFVAVLEPEAGIFSVPSKVLAYLCGGKPILLACPKENLAARIVEREQAGYVTDPDDGDAFISRAEALLSNPAERSRMGRNARAYAERAFDIERIAGGFERIVNSPNRHRGES